jgi:hypothetical protein
MKKMLFIYAAYTVEICAVYVEKAVKKKTFILAGDRPTTSIEVNQI